MIHLPELSTSCRAATLSAQPINEIMNQVIELNLLVADYIVLECQLIAAWLIKNGCIFTINDDRQEVFNEKN